MKRARTAVIASVVALSSAVGLVGIVGAQANPATLKVFLGGQLRPDVMRTIFDRFEKANPGIKVQIETGGATSDVQNQYLSTVLASKDSSLDLFLVDIVRVAQYAAAGWIEPLDAYFESPAEKTRYLSGVLPGPIQADTIGGKLFAIPAFTDSQFLYYRKDLLAKYNARVPRTWTELAETAQRIVKAENNPNLQGFNFQGAPIAGTVCTFLQPFWSGGGSVTTGGKVTVDNAQGRQALGFLMDSINKYKITPASIAEVPTDLSRKQFQAGDVLFGLNWGYAWAHFQGSSPDPTRVKGNVGVAQLPTFGNNPSASCVGGWQWVTSAYSRQKDAAFKLIKYMGSAPAQAELAIKAGNIPARKTLYVNNAVLAANPHFKDLYPVILKARSRPISANYSRVEDIMKSNVNAVLAGAKTIDAALKDMQSELEQVLR